MSGFELFFLSCQHQISCFLRHSYLLMSELMELLFVSYSSLDVRIWWNFFVSYSAFDVRIRCHVFCAIFIFWCQNLMESFLLRIFCWCQNLTESFLRHIHFLMSEFDRALLRRISSFDIIWCRFFHVIFCFTVRGWCNFPDTIF